MAYLAFVLCVFAVCDFLRAFAITVSKLESGIDRQILEIDYNLYCLVSPKTRLASALRHFMSCSYSEKQEKPRYQYISHQTPTPTLHVHRKIHQIYVHPSPSPSPSQPSSACLFPSPAKPKQPQPKTPLKPSITTTAPSTPTTHALHALPILQPGLRHATDTRRIKIRLLRLDAP